MKPLESVRVLDLTNVLAGPFCGHQLAHMGAEVIKIERPGSGDLARQLGADPALNARQMGISFLAQNSGKRSVTIDLKTDRGKGLFRRLAATAQVVVENFRPGVMERLGLGYETLSQDSPGLVYCAISGFGQDGPLRDLPAYDQIVQGMSGVMSITGGPDTAPYRVGYPVADTIGGLTAAFAIAAALARPAAERGCFIDVSMLEAVMATMGWAVSDHLIGGIAPAPRGNDNITASPSGTFRTEDGLINIAANKQEQFEAVCDVVDRPELKTDPRFLDRHARLANRTALSAALEQALAARGTVEWCDRLAAAGVPAGQVLSVQQALEHPQIAERGMIAQFDTVPGLDRPVRLARPGIKIDGKALETALPPPQLGTHTDEVLADLGLSEDEVEALRADGVV